MDKELVLTRLMQVIDEKKSDDSWTDLALIGGPLARMGIDYKSMGFLKLKDLLKDFSNAIELREVRDDILVN